MLAYFLLHRRAPQARQHLAFLFWPDSSETQAKTNLRRELYHLRRLLPNAEQFLVVDSLSVRWRSEAQFTLDVADFELLLAEADQIKHANRQAELVTTPATPTRDQQELALLLSLNADLVTARGFSVSALGPVLERARDLAPAFFCGAKFARLLHGRTKPARRP